MGTPGQLGEKIGEGAFADVHAWAPGQVVKLFKAGVPRRIGRHEAQVIRAVFAAGVPAPEVFDEVEVEGRFGIVLTRFDGPTLLQLSRSGALTFEQTGAILATVCMAVHNAPPPAEVPTLRDWIDHWLRFRSGMLPGHVAPGILSLVERLPVADALCHCDLHPGNVIMTADGPRIIDWDGAIRAPAALDLACCHIGLSEVAPEIADNPARPRAVNAALQSEYARLSGMSLAALTAAMEPYLPIARLHVLVGVAPAQRERLIQRIAASFGKNSDALAAGAGSSSRDSFRE
jgi:Ser/Thr protein kinase RdoA (MazF antagonist)